jgi:[ribosomal protein S18]-alanine N-acetyltransferase
MRLDFTQAAVRIKWMIRANFPEVLAIEAASFVRPLSEEEMLSHLRRRECIGMVAEARDRVLGFIIYELHPVRIVILDFAVHPESRRQLVGREMVDNLTLKLSGLRRTSIRIDIRESNLAGQLFFSRMGFRAVEVLREHFPDTGEDAYRMEYHLGEH